MSQPLPHAGFYFYFFRHKLNNYGFEWWLAVFFSNPVIGGLHGPNNKLKLFGIYQSSVHIMGNLIVDWLLFEHLSYLFIKKRKNNQNSYGVIESFSSRKKLKREEKKLVVDKKPRGLTNLETTCSESHWMNFSKRLYRDCGWLLPLRLLIALHCFRFHDPERRKDEVNKFGRILFK